MPIGSNPAPDFLTASELATLLKISKVGVYRLVEKRRIRFYKITGSLRFEKEDVLSFLKESRIEPVGATKYGSTKN